MEKRIKEAIENPEALENLYREDKHNFKIAFKDATEGMVITDLIRFWKFRLKGSGEEKMNFVPLIITLIAVIFLTQIPRIFGITGTEKELFYMRNLPVIIFASITFYELFRKENSKPVYWLVSLVFYAVMVLHLNILNGYPEDQTFMLAIVYAPVLAWFTFGFIYNIGKSNDSHAWINFLRYNGDLLLFTGLILICWTILFVITISLFDSLAIHYDDHLILDFFISAVAISPVIASFAMERIPALTNKIVPLIARIFNPVLMIVLVIYLVVITHTGKSIYIEREFLINFNIILFTVLAVTIYSLSNLSGISKEKFQYIVLYLLTILACGLNLIALSAIVYRLITYGVTPNKLAVTGINLIVFANLIVIGVNLFHTQLDSGKQGAVSSSITRFLPLYAVWAYIIVIIFPSIFN